MSEQKVISTCRWCAMCSGSSKRMREMRLTHPVFGRKEVIYICERVGCYGQALHMDYISVRELPFEVVWDILTKDAPGA